MPPSSAHDRYRPCAARRCRRRVARTASWPGQYRYCPHAAGPSGSARCARARSSTAPVGVGDRIAAVATEGAAGDLDARRRLATFIFGAVEHAPDALHCRAVMAAGDNLIDAHFILDQAFQDLVERRVARQVVLVLLISL